MGFIDSIRKKIPTETIEIIKDGKLITEEVVYDSKGEKIIVCTGEIVIADRIVEINNKKQVLEDEKIKLESKIKV